MEDMDQIHVMVTEAVRVEGEDIRHTVAGHVVREATLQEQKYILRRLGFLPDPRLGETQH